MSEALLSIHIKEMTSSLMTSRSTAVEVESLLQCFENYYSHFGNKILPKSMIINVITLPAAFCIDSLVASNCTLLDDYINNSVLYESPLPLEVCYAYFLIVIHVIARDGGA